MIHLFKSFPRFIRYLCLFIFFIFKSFASDATVDEILTWISNTKQKILEVEATNQLIEEDLCFLTFWNFDKTILNGDSTEGSVDLYGKTIFKGLAQVSIESGFSKQYHSFAKFWKDYQSMEQVNPSKAYAYAAQIFAGAEEQKLLALATQYFSTTLKPYLFQASIDLIHGLHHQKISTQIITASPRIFVQGAASLLNIPLEDFYGMTTEVENGKLTDKIIFPLTTAEGKISKIKQIIQKKMGQYKKVYVLAGIGNYNLNDMPFLQWVVSQQLPAGEPLTVIDYHPPPVRQKNIVLLRLL